MFVLRSMRKHPRDFLADVSVNHSRTASGKAIDNTQGRASRLSSSGVPFARLQPVPRPQLGCDPAPLQRMTRPAPRVLCFSSCLAWAIGSRLWGTPGRPAADGPGPRPGPFRRSQLCYPVLASATAPAISGALSTRPQRRRRRWPDSKK